MSEESEFDCVLKKQNEKYAIHEVKFLSNPLGVGEQKTEIEQIQNIKGLDIDEIGFVCSSGFSKKIDNIKYIDLNNIFFK